MTSTIDPLEDLYLAVVAIDSALDEAGFGAKLLAEDNLADLIAAYEAVVKERDELSGLLNILTAPDSDATAVANANPVAEDPSANFTVVAEGAPSTSVEASWAAWPNSGTQRNEILRYIASQRTTGCTDDQAAVALGMNEARLASRRRELWVGGWIEAHPPIPGNPNIAIYEGEYALTRLTRKDCHAVVWRVSDKYEAKRPL